MSLIFILHVCVHCTVGLHIENTSYMHIRKILLLRYCCVHSFTISLLKPIYKPYINLYISVIVPAVYELQEIPTDRTEAAPHLQIGNQTEQLARNATLPDLARQSACLVTDLTPRTSVATQADDPGLPKPCTRVQKYIHQLRLLVARGASRRSHFGVRFERKLPLELKSEVRHQ